MRSRHQPQRSCVGCGSKQAQNEMMRIASKDGGTPVLDAGGSTQGRGAYLCWKTDCIEKAWKRRGLERTLKLKAAAPLLLKDELLQLVGSQNNLD